MSRKNYRKHEAKRQQKHVLFALVSLLGLAIIASYFHYEVAHRGAEFFGYYFFEMVIGKFFFGE